MSPSPQTPSPRWGEESEVSANSPSPAKAGVGGTHRASDGRSEGASGHFDFHQDQHRPLRDTLPLQTLTTRVAALLADRGPPPPTRARHREALTHCLTALDAAGTARSPNSPPRNSAAPPMRSAASPAASTSRICSTRSFGISASGKRSVRQKPKSAFPAKAGIRDAGKQEILTQRAQRFRRGRGDILYSSALSANSPRPQR